MSAPRISWADHGTNIALAAALRSEDPYCQVGATVLSAKGIVLGVGYNGVPSGVEIDWSDRDARRPLIIHAEVNALRFTTPDRAEGGLLTSTHFPCSACIVQAAAYGVREVTWLYPPDWNTYPADATQRIAARLGLILRRIDDRA